MGAGVGALDGTPVGTNEIEGTEVLGLLEGVRASIVGIELVGKLLGSEVGKADGIIVLVGKEVGSVAKEDNGKNELGWCNDKGMLLG